MLKKWLEEHLKLFGVLLLFLAALNGWVAYAIFSDHPIMASANAAMAVVIAGLLYAFYLPLFQLSTVGQ